ncbi:hypothetical protein [Mesorhizobium amorphae]|uniref:hypothetical protein n=1 Tax=Mesorhizobium amorphae TaxID=71433 RepID=UPI0011830ECA|nr:hypothetical protein [Mesorhizobium amorphae]
MTDNPLPTSVAQWHAAIAEKSGTTIEKVTTTLETYGVRPQPVLPRARTVTVTSVRLEGQKRTTESDNRFLFEWTGLGSGFWALLSEGNSKGKSSILLSVRAALQGRFPGRIKGDVWSWIDAIDVGISIDGIAYCVAMRKQVGEQDERKATGSLIRYENATEALLYQGPPELN